MKKSDAGNEWFSEKEASTSTRPYRLTFWCLKHFPRWLVSFIAHCAALYFFIFDKRCRLESIRYQKNLKACNPRFKKIRPLRQVAAFAVTIAEKIDCWTNQIPFENIRFNDDDVYDLIEMLNKKRGVFLFVSHLGDSEVLRSLANKNEIGAERKVPILVLSDMEVSSNFSKALDNMSSGYTLNMLNVNDITPASIEKIQQTIEEGGAVVCAGDRLSRNKTERVISQKFLGKDAPFSYGAYFLADLIGAPTYFVWGFRDGNLFLRREHNMFVIKARSQIGGPRKGRDERIKNLCAEFAGQLERFVEKYPYQWYNFFDFWMFPNGEENGTAL